MVDAWQPLCMTPDELEAWDRMNDLTAAVGARSAVRPCIDCPLWFAREQRAAHRCNGMPGPEPERTTPDAA